MVVINNDRWEMDDDTMVAKRGENHRAYDTKRQETKEKGRDTGGVAKWYVG